MNYLDKDYIDLKLKTKKYEAQMEIVQDGLKELKKRLVELVNQTSYLKQDVVDDLEYSLNVLVDVLNKKDDTWLEY